MPNSFEGDVVHHCRPEYSEKYSTGIHTGLAGVGEFFFLDSLVPLFIFGWDEWETEQVSGARAPRTSAQPVARSPSPLHVSSSDETVQRQLLVYKDPRVAINSAYTRLVGQ